MDGAKVTSFDKVRPEHRERAKAVVGRARRVLQVTDEELAGPSRAAPIADARGIVADVLERRTTMSWGEIGSLFGRDRTSAISWATSIRRRLDNNPDLVRLIERVDGSTTPEGQEPQC